jgi:phage FluMu gp28-like protein
VVPWWLCSFFCRDVRRAAVEAPDMPTEDRVRQFGTPAIVQQLDSLPLEDFQQEFEAAFIDESYSFYAYDLILPCTSDDLRLCDDFTDIPFPQGRIVAGFDVGRTRDRSELAVFEENHNRFTCMLLRSYNQVPFAEQEADLRRLLEQLPVARLSIDKSGIGMNLAENLSRDYPQVAAEIFSNESKERWATDFKILLQRRDVILPRDRDMVAQIHAIKRRVLPSGKISFDAERTSRGHADRFWAIALACQKERGGSTTTKGAAVTVRVIG